MKRYTVGYNFLLFILRLLGLSFILLVSVHSSFAQSKTETFIKGCEYGKDGKLDLAKKEFNEVNSKIYVKIIEDAEKGMITRETAKKILQGKWLIFKKEDFDTAVAVVEQAVALNPNYAEAYVELAQAYHFKGKYASQLIKNKKNGGFSITVAVDPEQRKMMYWDKAIVNLEKAVKFDPSCARAYDELSKYYLYVKKDKSKAQANYVKVKNLGLANPTMEKALREAD